MIPSFSGGFTVLMALYRGDDAFKFEKAVESVFSNTLNPERFILVIDGPLTDALESMVSNVKSRQGSQFEVLRIKKNVGLAKALNLGLKMVTTTWVVRADSDDVNLPNRFIELAKAHQKDPDLALIGSAILEFDENYLPISVRETPLGCDDIKSYAVRRNPFNHMSVAYKASVVRGVGGYPNLYLREDYALWCLLIKNKIKMVNLDLILVHVSAGYEMYRRRGGFKYAKEEFRLQKLLIECDMKGPIQALIDGLIRAALFMLPVGIRGWLYRKKLRSSLADVRGTKY
jgi:glycosyltransferase involved in cell wall biosynthesis